MSDSNSSSESTSKDLERERDKNKKSKNKKIKKEENLKSEKKSKKEKEGKSKKKNKDMGKTDELLKKSKSNGINLDSQDEEPVIISLRGISVSKVDKDYREGKYKRFLPPDAKVYVSTKKMTANIIIPGLDTNDEIFTAKIDSDTTKTYITTNNESFKTYLKDGTILMGGKCNWCGNNYETPRFGVPTVIGEPNKDGKMPVGFESDSCGLLCSRSEGRLLSFDPQFGDKFKLTDSILCFLFEKMYPGREFGYAPPYWLIKGRGGTIDVNDEKYEKYIYIPVPDVTIMPVKSAFERIKIEKNG